MAGKENTFVDTKEFELPETVFSQDIENRVFQALVLQTLAKIDGVGLLEGSIIDNILRKSTSESLRGISTEVNEGHNSISIKVEVNIRYGIPIPEKSEEIQNKICEAITTLTGLHVAAVHIVFRNVFLEDQQRPTLSSKNHSKETPPTVVASHRPKEFTDEF